MDPKLYDTIYSGLPRSRIYRAILSEAGFDLPDWAIVLSATTRPMLERIAAEMGLIRKDAFVDLACGLGSVGLWIAERTGAVVTGVDFSSVAIAAATQLARTRAMGSQSRFAVADAVDTGLETGAFRAVVCIDSLQFLNASAASTEIARLLAPGGTAVVTTWEAVQSVELDTVVRDYRPFFESAGLTFTREILEDAVDWEDAHYRALLAHADDLRAEIGEGAEPLLFEAQSGIERAGKPRRVRKVLIVGRKP